MVQQKREKLIRIEVLRIGDMEEYTEYVQTFDLAVLPNKLASADADGEVLTLLKPRVDADGVDETQRTGIWLDWIAGILFDQKTAERTFGSVIADIRFECSAAASSGDKTWWIRTRGTFSFWIAVISQLAELLRASTARIASRVVGKV
jgi:hypothetical protein